jgi:arylsulfatase
LSEPDREVELAGVTARRPNILFFHVDNLGMGELGCYGGGIVRGAETGRTDAFAREGLQLWHYIAEPQCTPSRSALLTGRYAIRSGTHTVPRASGSQGLVAWERTMGDILSEAGYATACFGKWHLGAEDGRWATDHGFDEWYGPPRSYDESRWYENPWWRADRDLQSFMHEGERGVGVRRLDDQPLTIELRRDIDVEYTRRALAFLRKSVAESRPFYLYFNHSLLHVPTIPRAEFQGASGNGDWADCLVELDQDFGTLLDALDELGVAGDTIVVYAGDNGAENLLIARGSAGVFEGSYFTSSEGGLRTPCLIRWPGRVAPGRASNEMVHQTDLFTTMLFWAGCSIPDDREIDGVDQRAFFEGSRATSSREGCLVWVADVLHAVKWQHFKVAYVRQRYSDEAPQIMATPVITNLLTDPKERESWPVMQAYNWVHVHAGRLRQAFEQSIRREPPIPAGAPLDHVPDRHSEAG